MSEIISVAALQTHFNDNEDENLQTIMTLIEQAAIKGAKIILAPELFLGPYFCKEQSSKHFNRAHPLENHPALTKLAALAQKLEVVLPVSFFELAKQSYYNSIAVINADGTILGVYRKSHIPDGPGYQEKFYFRPGDTGFRVWQTRFGTIGVGICWDQWFPEAARAMVLMGADILFYPTAIGSEPSEPSVDTKDPWQRVMVGHAVANIIPVVAANRVGNEDGQIFYGSSFIANYRGDLVAEMSRSESGVIYAEFDFDEIRKTRAGWGFFRDRRPELYGILSS